MEISPVALSWLTLQAFLLGILLGVLHDANRLVRVICGVHYSEKRFQALYARPLPVVHRPIRTREAGRLRRGGLAVLILLQDILFFVAAAIGIVLIQYEHNSGRFRLFVLIAAVVGFLLYYFTVGKLVMLLSEGIVFCLKAAVCIVLGTISRPFRAIFRFFVKKIKIFISNLKIVIEKRQKKLYNKNRRLQLLKKAEHGFLEMKGRHRDAQKK